jgi:hypothetical protein
MAPEGSHVTVSHTWRATCHLALATWQTTSHAHVACNIPRARAAQHSVPRRHVADTHRQPLWPTLAPAVLAAGSAKSNLNPACADSGDIRRHLLPPVCRRGDPMPEWGTVSYGTPRRGGIPCRGGAPRRSGIGAPANRRARRALCDGPGVVVRPDRHRHRCVICVPASGFLVPASGFFVPLSGFPVPCPDEYNPVPMSSTLVSIDRQVIDPARPAPIGPFSLIESKRNESVSVQPPFALAATHRWSLNRVLSLSLSHG